MNTLVTYGQTFSKGQLTIPKKIRDFYGLGFDFAYKISGQDKKIIIEPQTKHSPKKLLDVLESIDEAIFSEQDYQEWQAMREQDESRLQKLGL